MTKPAASLTRYETRTGRRIYTLNVHAFHQLRVNVFLVLEGPAEAPTYSALIDAGSSGRPCHDEILSGLAQVRAEYGEQFDLTQLSRVILTHPHPDHAGGLPLLRELTAAPLAAYAGAVSDVEHPEARVRQMQGRAEEVIRELGVPEGDYAERLRRRAQGKMLPSGVKVETPLSDGQTLDERFTVIYTPGHEASQICLLLDEVLFSADHLLPRNSPPLQPGWMWPGHGLGPYLAALDKIEALETPQIALGGHDEPMLRWRERAQHIRKRYGHKERDLLAAADTARTAYQLTLALHPQLRPLQALLLIDQTAALTEFLSARGLVLETRGMAGERLYTRA